jgi:hypothetical protein
MVSPFAAAGLFLLFYNKLISLTSALPSCPFNRLGLLCPGCGNTRALSAFMHGHFIESIFYNPSIFILAVFFLLFYIEQAFALFGKKIKLVPRKPLFYIILGILLAAYFVLRNIPAFSWLTWIKA